MLNPVCETWDMHVGTSRSSSAPRLYVLFATGVCLLYFEYIVVLTLFPTC